MFIELSKFIANTNLIETFNSEMIWFNSDHQPLPIIKEDYDKLKECLLECDEVEQIPIDGPVKSKPSELGTLLTKMHSLLGGRGEPKLTTDRKARLATRLKDFTPEDLLLAAKNLGEDEFMQGGNDNGKRYGTIDYLIRTSVNVNKYLEDQPEKKKPGMF